MQRIMKKVSIFGVEMKVCNGKRIYRTGGG